MGSGVGAPFGPRCHKGDIMGCGVLFPRNYECKSDSEEELEQQGGIDQYGEGGRCIILNCFLSQSISTYNPLFAFSEPNKCPESMKNYL